jgi:NhaP-type Na+/H+ or K+/H+ antiporter
VEIEVAAFVVAFAVTLLAWALFGGRLERLNMSRPFTFAAGGLLAGLLLRGEAVGEATESEALLIIAEVTLAMVLFSDAARLGLGAARRSSPTAGRLLIIGLPLAILAGWGVGLLTLDGLGVWDAALLAAILVPTDAALGAAVVESEAVPRKVRNALNVESGLNDGGSFPFFTLFLALALGDGEVESAQDWVVFTVEQIGFGAIVGALVGAVGGYLLMRAEDRDWLPEAGRNILPLALAILAWGTADLVEGNGFIAAFVAGLVVRWVTTSDERRDGLHLADTEGRLATNLIFFIFGFSALGVAFDGATWMIAFYALLSLTLIRMVPVAIALAGTGLGPRTVGFIGWFGPRGLASIVLTLTLMLESGELASADLIQVTAAFVVAMSILAHGVTARPLSERYGQTSEAAALEEDAEEEPSVPTRADAWDEG